jgi:hypothetical protein
VILYRNTESISHEIEVIVFKVFISGAFKATKINPVKKHGDPKSQNFKSRPSVGIRDL